MALDVTAEMAFAPLFASSSLFVPLLLSLVGQKNAPQVTDTFKSEYDYIIVGGGSAGSTLAGRLSEVACVSVLLLEAGDLPPVVNDIPCLIDRFARSEFNWGYRSAPQKHTAKSFKNNSLALPTGKGLGGSSLLNAMMYIRGNKQGFDEWARDGATGWSYEDVLPYFLKSEGNRDYNNSHHNVAGSLSVEMPRDHDYLKQTILDAGVELGYPIVDINSDQLQGFVDLQATMRRGQRCSASKAFLVPAENRTNLDIVVGAYVEKVNFDGNRAASVTFARGGEIHEVKARKEIIISAGTINTAKVLILSGIGPKEHLQELKIPLVADLPVGKNFHDHASTFVNIAFNKKVPNFAQRLIDPDNIQMYIASKTGPLTRPLNVVLAFVDDEKFTPNKEPKIQLYFTEIDITHKDVRSKVYQQLLGPYLNSSWVVCSPQVLKPRSRGTVRLKSKDPRDHPLVDPNYFSDPQDVEVCIKGMKLCKKVADTEAMKNAGGRVFETLFPGCEEYAAEDDKYFRCQLQQTAGTFSHFAGTAKMGNPQDASTVVDPQLRVKSVRNLRVVDASVMPTLPSGNINAPVIMMAEKAADMIKETIDCDESEASVKMEL